jgi:hypothetical protein
MKIWLVEVGYAYEGGNVVRAFTNEQEADALAADLSERQRLEWDDDDRVAGDYVEVNSVTLDEPKRYTEAYTEDDE